MATLAEIREKYPQYSDMPDAALADALHSRFYSDMPRDQFNAKIGFSSVPTGPGGFQVPQAGKAGSSDDPQKPKYGIKEFGEDISTVGNIILSPFKAGSELTGRALHGEIIRPEGEDAAKLVTAASVGAAPIGRAAGAVADVVLPPIGRAASDVLPGGTARARGMVSEIGSPASASVRGDAIRDALANDLRALGPGQRTQFEAALKARGIDPYNRDAAKLAASVFKSRDNVELLKRLSPEGSEWIERSAGDYAASQLDGITGATSRSLMPGRQAAGMADRAERWARQNEDWLQATPETRQAVNEYISYLRRTSTTQKVAGVVGFGTFLSESGGIPWWIRHFLF